MLRGGFPLQLRHKARPVDHRPRAIPVDVLAILLFGLQPAQVTRKCWAAVQNQVPKVSKMPVISTLTASEQPSHVSGVHCTRVDTLKGGCS